MVPYFYSLVQPSSEQMSYYINSFIVLVKKRLGFSRHAVGKKHLSIETFPQHVFVYLFKNEETFKYSPARHKYQCHFEGLGYVLLEDYENKYQVKFTWNQTILTENNREFVLGRMSCNFVTDSKEFQKNDEKQISTSKNEILLYPKTPIPLTNPSFSKETNKKRFRHILSWPPLQDINQLQ
ncbi:hypothetical protein GLOIN_2v1842188 [Rhizophagus clarus]|uniref:Uncharacterized protein n=1 Tax=Rhizophagus clarus TaxID=94130 RepID=A0A8H3LID6_9GLOM|nr:hypothetical protein GLOIN_2v1842188 [Rhizophagus clarus]